ncbi:hypothetical protein E2562_004435, partial [Oryza meyeriana var. granulata]
LFCMSPDSLSEEKLFLFWIGKGTKLGCGCMCSSAVTTIFFRLMKKAGADSSLLVKEHTHMFVNKGGTIGDGAAEVTTRWLLAE